MQKKKISPAVWLCALLSLLYFTSYITRLNFSASIAEMVSVGVFSKTQGGVIGTALFFTYGFGQIISGVLSDKFDPGKIVAVGLVLTALCNLLFAFSDSVAVMAVLWGVNGFAQALFWPPIVRILSYYFDDSGYAKGNLAVSYACHGATILIYLIVPFGIKVADWRFSFFFGALLAAAVLIVWCAGYWRLVSKMDKTAEREGTTHPSSAPLIKTLAVSGVLIVLVAIALQGYLKDGIQSWLPTFFTEVFEMDSSKAILMNMVVPVSSIVFVSLATVLFRKVFRNEVAESIFLFSVTTVLSLLVAVFYTKSPAVTLVLSALVIGCAHGVNTMLISFLPRRFERIGKAATVGGICNASVYVGSAASSYGIALIATNAGWAATLISWGIIAFLGIIMCVIALPQWKKYIKN